MFKTFCKAHNIQLILNAVATPRANGQVERLNRTVLAALSTTSNGEDKWDEHVNQIQIAINNTVHQITGKSPNQLFLGYSPRLRNDCVLSAELNLEHINVDIEDIRKEASEKIRQSQLKQKETFDRRRKKPKKYKPGDLVLIQKNNHADGLSKK